MQQEQQEKLVISAAVERGERLGKGGWSGVFYVKKGKVWRGEVFGCIFCMVGPLCAWAGIWRIPSRRMAVITSRVKYDFIHGIPSLHTHKTGGSFTKPTNHYRLFNQFFC